MLSQIKNTYKLKEQLKKFQVDDSIFKPNSLENLSNYEKSLVIKKYFNDRYHFLETIYTLQNENRMTFLYENIKEINDLDVLLQLYLILDFENKFDIQLEVKDEIVRKLNNNEKINSYLKEWLLVFCNRNNMDFTFYSKLIEDDRHCLDSELNISPEVTVANITPFEGRDTKYYHNLPISDTRYFNLTNNIHIKNILHYLKIKGWSSDRNTDYSNQTNLYEFLNFEQTNLLSLFNELDINFSVGTIFFSSKLDKFRWDNKENYENYRLIYAYDLRNNQAMSIDDKIIFVENILDSIQNFDNERYELDIIDFLEKKELNELLEYKNITNLLLTEYIKYYNEKDITRTNYLRRKVWFDRDEMERGKWSEKTILDSMKKIIFEIKETDGFYVKLFDVLSKEKDMGRKIEYLSIINDLPKSKFRKSIFNKIFKVDTLLFLMKLNYDYQKALYGRDLNVREILENSPNILKIIVDTIYMDFEKMNDFIHSFRKFSFDNKKVKEFIFNNFSKLLDKKKSTPLIVFGFKEGLITEEEKNIILSEKIYDNYLKKEYLYSDELKYLSNIDLLLNKNCIPLNFDILWKYWKEKDGYVNISELVGSNKIFDLLNNHTAELLSSKAVIETLVKEPFSSYDSFETNKKIEFISAMIDYNKNTTMWNYIQEMAPLMDIKIMKELKESFYYTNENILEDIFEI